jgi:hypothetical protein
MFGDFAMQKIDHRDYLSRQVIVTACCVLAFLLSHFCADVRKSEKCA